jgi:hypothetical protein
MDRLCHRCGNSLREGDGFCPSCGAPQLVVEASDSAAPQQPALRLREEMQTIHWRAAILSALLVAIPVGLLSGLTRSSALFPIGGGFAAIALYRRRGGPFTDGRIGWRVGAILGALSAFVASGAWGVELLIERYLLHEGSSIDAEFATVARQMADQALKSNNEALQQAPELMHKWASFWLSADGHAAIQLLIAFSMSLGIVMFAAVGGAIASRVLAVRAREQRTL